MANVKKGSQLQATVSFQVDESVLVLIDKYAKTLGLSRSQLIRNLVATGLVDAKVLKVTGILDVVGLIRGLEDKDCEIEDDFAF